MGAQEASAVWPRELLEVFERAITCEYASLTRAGSPVTVPTTPYVGSGQTLDVSTGLTYPAKAERARRNPKVALLFADPIGVGAGDGPVVLVQGHAAVRDSDLQANTDRYARESIAKLPASVEGQPKALLRRMVFYYARIWIEITPVRIRWWSDRSLSEEPRVWSADSDRALPESDPAPSGRQPPAWLEPPQDWREVAARALRGLPFTDLTVVDRDGFPVCVPVTAGAMDADSVPLQIGARAPELPDGPACLTVHGHDDRFTTQENHTLIGTLASTENGARLHVERALADWSLTGNRLQRSLGFLRKGRRLTPRLKAEAARRGQPVPTVRLP
ncbi:MAG TPA: pyridoxamine 5'-phosphate oxidase family protein [Solirubrobacteraceae bacterium]|nr:pyridoxamine 5'-phosphate oxidase family protein [Solirubrobacteraceae bacterium]